jgi:O-antigen ligase
MVGDSLPAPWLPVRLRAPLTYLVGVALALAIGAAIPLLQASLALRIAVGLPFILVFLRYRYSLLVAWILLGALVGSTLTLLSGKNIDTGLTIPTLLLLFTTPVFQTLRRVPALALLFLYLLWALVGIQSSPLGTTEFLTTWLLDLDYAVVAVLAVSLVATRRHLLLLVDAMLAVGTFIALYGIAGYLTHQNGALESATGTFRIVSIFTAAPPFALFLSMVIPLALYRAVIARGAVRAAPLGALLVLVIALGLTFSRGAILSVPLSLLIVACVLPSPKLRAGLIGSTLGLGALAVIVTVMGHVPLFARFSGRDISSLNGRTYLWQALLAHFDPWRLQGNGLGAATAILTRLNIGNNGVTGNGLIATAPSNLYIGALYDSGVIGLALLLSALVTLGVALTRGTRRATGEHRLLFAMALLALINMLVQSIEVDDLWTQGIALYFWLTVSLPFAACWSNSGYPSHAVVNGFARPEPAVPAAAPPQAQRVLDHG